MIGSMFVGLLVGLLAGALTNRGERMGCFGKMFLGWIGAFLGHLLFGTWGPVLLGTAIIPAISYNNITDTLKVFKVTNNWRVEEIFCI